ncbi:phosphatase PAP2 family protein [Aeromicrobium senzhongii]|uniref:Phosphatase PAP2 family protein n=1 Tax=Aeromicrobium senzhongii TaxID=2663859 RepID=A0ABX6SSP9_9ACTN|nr:phosphatase PAP2 family protein [Aeromicrobium senzhongii]MTB89435.1 phosphatase PAP2 family protein [Aeromicrobium senzhongii]QNL94424.1 phosphatase PAP2 family protein [Aeromicrobium senzhongii]
MTRSRSSVVGPALVVGAGAAALFFAVVSVALWSTTGQAADEDAMLAVTAGREARLTVLSILGRVSIGTVAVLAVGCLLLAALRRHGRAALAALTVIVGANVTTQVLKHGVLDRADLGYGVHNSLPSGHVTVVAAAVAALLIVVPPAARASVAGLGTFATGLTGLSTIVAGWHRPADVVAALLVTLGWCAVGVLVHGGRRSRDSAVFLTALSGAVASLIGIVLIGVRPVSGLEGFLQASLVLGAVALASACAIWLMSWICPDASRV